MAVTLPGSDSYAGTALTTSTNLLNVPGRVTTVSFWARQTSLVFEEPLALSTNNDTFNYSVQFYINPGTGKLELQTLSSIGNDRQTAVVASTPNFTSGVWHHIAAILRQTNGGNLELWLDGVHSSVPTITWGDQEGQINTISIGCEEPTPIVTYPWNGQVSNVAMWQVGLPDIEIQALATGAHPFTVGRGNLKHYWPLDGISSQQDVMGTLPLTPLNATLTERLPLRFGGWR